MTIRFARETELEDINRLRKQVFDLHAAGKPDVFKSDFSGELRDYIRSMPDDEILKITIEFKEDSQNRDDRERTEQPI